MPVETTRACAAATLVFMSMLASPASAGEYVQAPGSTLTFATQFQGEVFVGRLPSFSTRVNFDPKRLATSTLDVSIALTDASVANPEGDDALRGPDFFNVARFPQARFKATGFRKVGRDRYVADGTLMLRGISKPVALSFDWIPGARPVLNGKATVRRLDFGVGGGDWAATDLIPNEIAISTRVMLVPVK